MRSLLNLMVTALLLLVVMFGKVAVESSLDARNYQALFEGARGDLEAYQRTRGHGIDPAYKCRTIAVKGGFYEAQ